VTQGTRSAHTTLYRLYNADDELLYVGIAGNPGRRFEQHAEDKPWWSEVAATKLEHFATREAACAAEVTAITTEKPRHNIVHNRGRVGRSLPTPRVTTTTAQDTIWTFESCRYAAPRRQSPLWLYPELDLSAGIDNCWDEDGEGMLDYYLDYIEREHPEWLAADAVPICWFVEGDGVIESAPFQHLEVAYPHDPVMWDLDTFLTHFTWPWRKRDDGEFERLDWMRLPVRNDRFKAWAEALGWTPSPMQPTAPLSSIIQSRRGDYLPHLLGQVRR
jgi:predicted GIY-YIG superfamily endonuclease